MQIKRAWLAAFATAAMGWAQTPTTLYMVGHAHIDPAYRWQWNETLHTVLPYTFRNVLDLMDREPNLTFAQSQMSLYEATRKEYPEIFARIQAKIRAGTWAVVGGQWTEPLAMSANGEALVRDFLLGEQYARDVLGVDVKVGWLPDAWDGQNIGLPQLLKGAGIDYYVVARGRIDGMPVYWWKGPSGARVVVYNVPFDYSFVVRSPDEITKVYPEWRRATGTSSIMQIYGRGDHGGGPREGDVEALRKFAAAPGAPAVEYGTPQHYFDTVIRPVENRLSVRRAAIPPMGPESKPAPGETPAAISFASPMSLRVRYHKALSLLLAAETFSTIGTLNQRKPFYPRVDFDDAWRLLVEMHDHNTLTAVSGAYDDIDHKFDALFATARRLEREGLDYIGARVDTRGAGVPLIVYNPSSWMRSGVVEAHLHLLDPAAALSIRDEHGRELALQSVRTQGEEHDVLIRVADLPPTGYRLFRAYATASQAMSTGLSANDGKLENEFLRIEVDRAGRLVSIYDKRTDREWLRAPASLVELTQEDPGKSNSYVLEARRPPAELELELAPALTERGPVRATLRCGFRAEDSRIFASVSLSAHSDHVEFAVDADWHDRDKTLSVALPLRVDGAQAAYERDYAFEEMAATGQREPLQHWFDLSGDSGGTSVLVSGIGEGYASNGGVRLTLLRGTRDMNARMDEGAHHLRYALYPHAGGWREALTPRHAEEFNAPLAARQEPHHDGRLTGWGEHKNPALPCEYSFLTTAPGHVIATALKMSEAPWEPDALIVRVYEATGRATQAELKLGFNIRSAEEVNLIERPTGVKVPYTGETLRFAIGAGEIKTFRLLVTGRGDFRGTPAKETGGENEGGG